MVKLLLMGNHCDCMANKEKQNSNVIVDDLQDVVTKYNTTEKNQDIKSSRGIINSSEMSLKNVSNQLVISLDKKEVYEKKKFSSVEKKENTTDNSIIKIVLVGDTGVGKSTFVIKYVSNKFEPYHVVTLGTEYYNRQLVFNDSVYTLNFIVTSGDPEFQEDYTKSFQNVDFFLVMYDISNRKTFEKLKSLVEDIKKYLFSYPNLTSNIIIVGNKCDVKKREVNSEEAHVFCDANNLDLFEVSVKTNVNLNKIINKMLMTFDDTVKNQ